MELLSVSALSKHFGNVKAVKEIDFNIEAGRCVSLLGPNGAGKTTTLHMLSGLMNPSSGSITFQGVNQGDWRHHIGYLYCRYFNPHCPII
jgi:ABC-2 type transport system ATP-binding protein